MAQNIFDNPSFWKFYDKFPRSEKGESGASEWPELVRMLPDDLTGKRVLDLACGEGWFARWALARGAAAVDAMDISVNMLKKADRQTSSSVAAAADIRFIKADMERLSLSGRAYDVVFCGLALHYVKNIAAVFAQVHQSLTAGGVFVFSIEHPFLTAPTRAGFTMTGDGVDQWPVDSYFSEGERQVDWLVQGVRKQHRMLSTYHMLLVEAGFEMTALDEWGRTDDETRKHPNWVEGVCPRFLLIGARRRSERSWRSVFSILGFSSS